MNTFLVRPMTPADRGEVAKLILTSVNTWYQRHGMPAIFQGGPELTDIFYEVYSTLEPGCGLVAAHQPTGRLMGSCFFHPRPRHVALGIMNVHPDDFGHGVARALLRAITDYADERKLPVRLTQSALNLDSFSLYNRAGFVPRSAYQDMLITVPAAGLPPIPPSRAGGLRDATLADVPALAELELEISGVTRELDYRHVIGNAAGFWHASVFENAGGRIEGFLASSRHAACNMIGPGFCRTEEQAIALIHRELNANAGRTPVVLVPVERSAVVRQLYDWGARNCELHFCQVRGASQPFAGLNFPTFLLETA
jgi:GNAT superfamily N-acetyltransferase